VCHTPPMVSAGAPEPAHDDDAPRLALVPGGLSIVLPCHDEEASLPALLDELRATEGLSQDVEIVVVDDGSHDGTAALIAARAAEDPNLRGVFLTRNFGQSAALAAGIAHASGDVIVLIDADGQNDPADIPRLVAKLDEGHDVVSGWRRDRKDPYITRRLPSIIANRCIAWLTGVPVHDVGCTLKAYRRASLERVKLYGEMHRLLPALMDAAGARIAEEVVNHRPRTAGRSKYGLGRTVKVLADLLTVQLLSRYATKPLYFFGAWGLGFGFIGLFSLVTALVERLTLNSFEHRFSLVIFGMLALFFGAQSVLMGLLAELQVRTYFESQQKPVYQVRETVNLA
jgi:glycosyltransferase involved in cell wall biosynthesis